VARQKVGFWVRFAAGILRPVTRVLGRRALEGLGRIPRTGAALLVFNHVSYLDPIYDAVFVYEAGRVPRFLAKNTLWKLPLAGTVLAGTGQIPVYRGTAEAGQSLRAAHQALSDGEVVAIYPEGTITRDPDGWPMHSRVGVARLALENDVPVIPVARWGTLEVYDHYGKRFRPFPRKQITIKVGEPIDLSAYREGRQDSGNLREVTEAIMSRVRDLLAEIRGEQAPSTFYVPTNTTSAGENASSGETTSDGGNASGGGSASGGGKAGR
jgi:1-acyl-sn-glycerol-3-phosphate acyltransferase